MTTKALWFTIPLVPALAISLLAQPPASKSGAIATVSAQRISLESVPGKASRERVQALQRQLANDLHTKQQALEATRQQFSAQADPTERAKLQTQGENQRAEFERAAAKAQADVQALDRQVNAALLVTVRQAVGEVVKGRDIQVVLNADSSVIWSAPTLDITDAVIARLNAAPPPAKN